MYSPTADINSLTFAFLDIETTGLSAPMGGRICEIAILKKNPDGSTQPFSQLIDPLCVIPQVVINIHGITNEMVEGKPCFKQIAPKLISLLQDCVVICHNQSFDIGFISYELDALGLKFPPVTVLDTLEYSRRHGGFASNRLGNIAKELGFSNQGWHRALNDVNMTERLFSHFLEKFKADGAKTLHDLVKLQKTSRRKNETNPL